MKRERCPRCGGVMGVCACQRPAPTQVYCYEPVVASIHHSETYALVDLATLRVLVMGALQAEAISLGRAAELLGLTLEEMRAQAPSLHDGEAAHD